MQRPGGFDDQEREMTGVDELSAYFRRMPVALYRSALDGELLAANPAFARLLGYETVGEMRDAIETVTSLYASPEERAKWVERIAELGVVYDFDVELKRRNESTIWVRDTARAVRDDQGEVLYYDGCLIDVTDKVQAQKTKDEFIATISHELRNPIAVMLGLGEELANNYEGFTDHDRRDMVHLISRQAEDASWLIEDLLVAYRDDLSKVRVTPQEFSVGKEVGRVLEVVDHPVEAISADSFDFVHADPLRTRQILRNLISNALRYGGTHVRVRTEKAGDRVEVRVEDSGDRIPDADVERIFKAYNRGRSASHPGSVGLGLSVARRLARLMDGDLVYRYHDGWSTFVLSLPAA